MTRKLQLLSLLMVAVVLAPCFASAQEAGKLGQPTGTIEFGGRYNWGDVYGRPDLPFTPSFQNSKFNEYRDLRNNVFVQSFRWRSDDFLGTSNFLKVQTAKTFYRDQGALATFGRYGKFNLQFRYDQTPHTISDTTRTAFVQAAPGVFQFPLALRQQLQGLMTSQLLPSTLASVANTTVGGFMTPGTQRKAATGSMFVNITENWNVFGLYKNEHQTGARPIGEVFNSSPSASLTGGFGVEVPESINYYNNFIKAGTEYGREKWVTQFGYTGSFFTNEIGSLTFDNPFRTTDCLNGSPTAACTSAQQGPATGRVDLYPDNQAQYFNFAGAFDFTKKIRLVSSINPGWLRQNDAFLPYTSNNLLEAKTNPLPSSSLHGEKQTLAMNYAFIVKPYKSLEFKAGYRHYDYNNNTVSRDFTPVQGDFAAPNLTSPEENKLYGYNKKNFELMGTWFFTKKSSVKAGYTGEWMDRSERDVEHSFENGFVTALDLNPKKWVNFRASYRHSDRTPDAYLNEETLVPNNGITSDQINHRRFDEAARLRDRFDTLLQFTPTDKLSFSAFGGTVQDDYNRRGGTNSATPLNFLASSAATDPYYLYGVLKDLSWNYGGDVDYALSKQVSLFGEYSNERYHKRMVSRYRVPGGTGNTLINCGAPSSAGAACDSANNDWGSTSQDLVNIWTAGVDTYWGKKAYLTTYYSLSAGSGNTLAASLGDASIQTGVNKFVMTGTNAAFNFPETTSRNHEVVAIFKFKITDNIVPKIEYRYTQFDSRDFQTTAMVPYMGCVSGLTGAAVPGCTAPLVGAPSPLYPYTVVGDTGAQRYLFLGTDQPSYKAHSLAATLEYHF